MNQQWQSYCEKFLHITPREQYLIAGSGLVAIIFILFSLFVDDKAQQITKLTKENSAILASNKISKSSIELFEQALKKDPNKAINEQIEQYQKKLAAVDSNLLQLTSDLINPVEMRYALMQLLKLQKGVSLQSFQVLVAQPINLADTPQKESAIATSPTSDVKEIVLYRHAIKIRLQGRYFQLRDYLQQVERLKWKFFWREFNYQVKEYPTSELEIELYSLSTKKEFVGV
jgi:MSHA biogenesis protein MshJ